MFNIQSRLYRFPNRGQIIVECLIMIKNLVLYILQINHQEICHLCRSAYTKKDLRGILIYFGHLFNLVPPFCIIALVNTDSVDPQNPVRFR